MRTPPDSTLRMRRLTENRRVPCVVPSYVDSREKLARLEDLTGHDCVALHGRLAIAHLIAVPWLPAIASGTMGG